MSKTQKLKAARKLLNEALAEINNKLSAEANNRDNDLVELTLYAPRGKKNKRNYINMIADINDTVINCPSCGSSKLREMKVAIRGEAIDAICICESCSEQCRVAHDDFVYSYNKNDWELVQK